MNDLNHTIEYFNFISMKEKKKTSREQSKSTVNDYRKTISSNANAQQ